MLNDKNYRVENIVAKGEIAHYEQVLLLAQCFQKSSAAETSKSVCTCMWERKGIYKGRFD